MEKTLQVLSSLPVGYMVPFHGTTIPDGFLLVDGQTLSKSEYNIAFSTLRGIVVDNGDTFTLPNKIMLQHMFPPDFGDLNSLRIILKIR